VFPVLPALTSLQDRAAKITGSIWKDIAIVAVQHLLESTGSLFTSLIALGVPSHRIHVLGKHYSSNQAVINLLRSEGIVVYDSTDTHPPGQFQNTFKADVSNMWAKVKKTFIKNMPAMVIILDDGGRCVESIPLDIIRQCRVIGIEQTTSGVIKTNHFTEVIQVATSAAKTILEPPFIASAVFDKAKVYLPDRPESARYGVIGIGNIGRSVANGLIAEGNDVYVTDKNPSLISSLPNAIWCEDAYTVLNHADYIFGCTGKDIFAGINNKIAVKGKKTLLSVSSEDVEFNSFLRLYSQKNSHSPNHDIEVMMCNALLRIMKGGFPINFDGSRISVASEAIQLTRALLLAGVIQAALFHKLGIQTSTTQKIMLDPLLQRFVVNKWLSAYKGATSIPKNVFDKFQNETWINAKSEGQFIQIDSLSDVFV
jgi:S-adenosylhomocysteine hydrolase